MSSGFICLSSNLCSFSLLLFELYCLSFLSRSCIYKLNIGLFYLCLYSELPLALVLYVFFVGGGKSGRVESGKFL